MTLSYAENCSLSMGCSPHSLCAIFEVKPEGMKTSSRKRCARLGEFILRSHGGTDADHLPMIPGHEFSAEVGRGSRNRVTPRVARFTVSNSQAPRNSSMTFSGARHVVYRNEGGSASSTVPTTRTYWFFAFIRRFSAVKVLPRRDTQTKASGRSGIARLSTSRAIFIVTHHEPLKFSSISRRTNSEDASWSASMRRTRIGN